MPLRVPDTLTGAVRPVGGSARRAVRLYVCGPTVYDAAHVGHARTYLYFDLARRWFDEQGIPVRHVMNITDFEDKITARAARLGLSWAALARREERSFLADLAALGLRRPHATPRASAFVPEMIATIRRLERRHALERRPDGWYYQGRPGETGPNFPVGSALAAHAVPEPGRPFPADPAVAHEFLVWRPQGPPAPSWPSPWGRGMPGWHLECFVMAREHLSLPVDLHGGGTDLIYPHHYAENEVAYTLADRPFADVYLHTAFVTARGRKMSKSTGNLISARSALDEFGPDGLRTYLLGTPFSATIEWRSRDAARARDAHEALREAVRGFLENGASGTLRAADARSAVARIGTAIADGFRVEAAFEALRDYVAGAARRPAARFARGERREARAQFRRVERLLGIRLVDGPTARRARG